MKRNTMVGLGIAALALFAVPFVADALPKAGIAPVMIAQQDNYGKLADEMYKAQTAYKQSGQKGAVYTQGGWYQSKQFGNTALGDARPPETNVFDPADKDCEWKEVKYADGQVHNLSMGGNSAYYFARKVTVSENMKVRYGIGSDDSFAFFLDGKRLGQRQAARAAAPNSDWVTADLKAGKEHVIVLKIQNGGGAAGFYYNPVIVYPTQAKWNELTKQFGAEADRINSADATFGPRYIMGMDNEAEAQFVKNLLPAKLAEGVIAKMEANANPTGFLATALNAVSLKKDLDYTKTQMHMVSIPSLLKAVDDLKLNHPGALSDIDNVRAEVAGYESKVQSIRDRLNQNELAALEEAKVLCALQKKIVFAAPNVKALNDILVVRRSSNGGLGLPANWQGNTSMGKHYDNEFGVYNVNNGSYKSLYRPENRGFVGDVDMHFDAERFLFSSISPKGRWQIFEMNVDGSGFRQVTADTFDDVDNYEAMYLPDERIIFTSSATFLGVPCVAGSDYVGNIHIMNKDGSGIRRLCFDQDNNWCPVLLEDGRVLYLRWEYTDSAHYFSRILMHMNPDGTAQNEFYGSNSYWPNSMFYARPLPGSTTQFVSVVTGHHGTARMGELYIFDITKGREETQGVVQQLKPYYGNSSKGKIMDQLVDASWPKFIYPHPLSAKQFLVSARPSPQHQWGLYIVDIFDNMTLLEQQPGWVLFEPTPILKTTRPPIIPDKVKLENKEATVFIQDVYEGTGLQGVPRGTVKALRIFQYEYAYRNMGGHYAIGMEAGWDIRRMIGTVPVYDDGSAHFIVPANTPFAIQPLDAEGKTLQQMRSWTVGMPGELVQCVGCHERQNQTVRPVRVQASTKAPVRPQNFYGQKRGFSFEREIQPILNRHCIQCHSSGEMNLADTRIDPKGVDRPWHMSGYSYSYWALQKFVRRNGPEGNYKILIPGEFHANTSELVQMLRKGHHGVQLEPEAWDKINAWIDFNVPYYGTWREIGIPRNFEERRKEMRNLYSDIQEDIEKIVHGDRYDDTPVRPKSDNKPRTLTLTAKDWPFSPEIAAELQKKAGSEKMTVPLGDGQQLTFVRIPAGEFNMGAANTTPDERPVHTIKIEKAFWMATTPVTLGQYKVFDPTHTNYIYDQHYKDQVRPGYHMDMKQTTNYTSMEPTPENYQPNYPAIRVNWLDAMAFCKWLGEKSGKKVTLPTEAQWEWACRAGSDKAMWYGDTKADFSKFANLADVQLKKMAVDGVDPKPKRNPNKYWDFLPKVETVDDGWLHLSPVGTYSANPFGLFDMHGNVSEWCRDNYRPYPYKTVESDTRTDDPSAMKTVRGGSWYNRPHRATSAFRLDFPAWQKVFDVGFRPIIEE